MKKWVIPILLILVSLAAYFWWGRERAATAVVEASLISLLMAENQAGFAQALEPGAIEFPRDLGPHEEYQIEWWYYTGNLATAEGRPFGFQLTFFRNALTPASPEIPLEGRPSPWRTNQVYLAHFALSDVANQQFYAFERFSRGAAGLAGAQAVPYRVWLDNWFAEEVAPGRVRLLAQTEDVSLDLLLTESLPPVLHGDRGLSPKGPEPGNASYYYSIVQQQTAGVVTVGGQRLAVTGLSWKDHEYSTSALSPGAAGWDWFSLQLDNGMALMFFQIRRQDGTLEPVSGGTFVYADGTTQHLTAADWRLEILDTWTSPTSGAVYPAGWRIHIPAVELELEGRPLMPNQELNVSTTYWEGAVRLNGTLAGEAVVAEGYIEMTGYGR
jgi:predicted secreted hydrolase